MVGGMVSTTPRMVGRLVSTTPWMVWRIIPTTSRKESSIPTPDQHFGGQRRSGTRHEGRPQLGGLAVGWVRSNSRVGWAAGWVSRNPRVGYAAGWVRRNHRVGYAAWWVRRNQWVGWTARWVGGDPRVGWVRAPGGNSRRVPQREGRRQGGTVGTNQLQRNVVYGSFLNQAEKYYLCSSPMCCSLCALYMSDVLLSMW